MLLKVSLKLPSSDDTLNDQAKQDLIRALIQIGESSQNNCEMEGKSRDFLEEELAKRWSDMIDNSQMSSNNFYLPMEYYKNKDEEDKDSDAKIIKEMSMQELIKRASTSVQENRFNDVEYE